MWAAATQQEKLLPFKYVSLKTLFLATRTTGVLTKKAYHVHSFANEDIYEYLLRVGSNKIPPTV